MDHYRIRKLTYYEKYGVKTFSYKGKRKYSSCLRQTFEGSIVVQNDIFGLTIQQFEKEFVECLKRRKSNQQKITNILYPNKTTVAYLEFIEHKSVELDGSIFLL